MAALLLKAVHTFIKICCLSAVTIVVLWEVAFLAPVTMVFRSCMRLKMRDLVSHQEKPNTGCFFPIYTLARIPGYDCWGRPG